MEVDSISHDDHHAHVSHIKQTHAKHVEKIRHAHKNVVMKHEKQLNEKHSALENALEKITELEDIVNSIGQSAQGLKFARLEIRELQTKLAELNAFKHNVLEYWPDAYDDPSSFGRTAKDYCQELIDADAMAPILQSNMEEEMVKEAKQSKSAFFKKMIKKVIVARRSENHHLEGHETMADVVEEVVVNEDNLDKAAQVHTVLKLEKEHKVLLENLGAREKQLKQEVVVLRQKHLKVTNVDAIKRVMNTHKAKNAAAKVRQLEKKIREKEEQLASTKQSVKAARFSNEAVKRLKDKYKAQLVTLNTDLSQKDKKIYEQETKIKDMEKYVQQTKAQQIKLQNDLNEYHTVLLELKKAGKTAGIKNQHVLKHMHGHHGKSFGQVLTAKQQGNNNNNNNKNNTKKSKNNKSLSPSNRSAAVSNNNNNNNNNQTPKNGSGMNSNINDYNSNVLNNNGDVDGGSNNNSNNVNSNNANNNNNPESQNIDSNDINNNSNSNMSNVRQQSMNNNYMHEQNKINNNDNNNSNNVDSLQSNKRYRRNFYGNNNETSTPKNKITRWVLPMKSPEEEDKISLTFGGIPWNTLNACCKNALLDYGRGNQRTLGHKPSDRPKKYVVSEEDMSKNLFRNGVV